MYRAAILAAVLPLLLVGAAGGQATVDDLELGVSAGFMQPSGGDEDYEDMGLTVGLRLGKPLTDNVSVVVDYHHGETESGDPPTVASPGRFFTWGATDYLKTNWNYIGLKINYAFAANEDFVPYIGAGLGMTLWEVQDWRGAVSDPGSVAEGYDADGRRATLEGNNLTASVGAGLEFFLGERMSIDIGGHYSFLVQQNVDNVGFSAVAGAEFVDANDSVFEGTVALMWHFGAGDCDGDGIFGSRDKCPGEKEDHDGFEDEDGCPDPDNDADGLADADDGCPDEAEDFDGDADEDGCPDVDLDGDGLADEEDACPEVPEDPDGFEDEDGCPDPDNDGDGVLDADDECPDTAPGTVVDAMGCEYVEPRPELVAVMINFEYDSTVLTPEMQSRLNALLEFLYADDTVTIDIGGHASDEGTDDYNEQLSLRRAITVRDYLADRGIDMTRMTVVGHGEQDPLVPNDSEANRQANRRAMVTPKYPD